MATLPGMEKTAVRRVLADNLKTLMERSKTLSTQSAVGSRAGVAQTSISQMLRPGNDAAKGPTLLQVEKVAHAFGLATWQLLLDPAMVGEQMADMLMRVAPTDADVKERYVNNTKAKRGAKA